MNPVSYPHRHRPGANRQHPADGEDDEKATGSKPAPQSTQGAKGEEVQEQEEDETRHGPNVARDRTGDSFRVDVEESGAKSDCRTESDGGGGVDHVNEDACLPAPPFRQGSAKASSGSDPASDPVLPSRPGQGAPGNGRPLDIVARQQGIAAPSLPIAAGAPEDRWTAPECPCIALVTACGGRIIAA